MDYTALRWRNASHGEQQVSLCAFQEIDALNTLQEKLIKKV